MNMEEFAKLAEAATPGPWVWRETTTHHALYSEADPNAPPYVGPHYSIPGYLKWDGAAVLVMDDGSAGGEYGSVIDPAGPDAAFIAAAREAVPALLADRAALLAFARAMMRVVNGSLTSLMAWGVHDGLEPFTALPPALRAEIEREGE